MIIEFHIIQNFGPSNLNSEETGAPKDCVFGGVRRGRISSQCLKRAMREYFRENFTKERNLAERTSRIVGEIAARLERKGKRKHEALRVAETAMSGLGLRLSIKDRSKTEYLFFAGKNEITKLAEVCLAKFDLLLSVYPPDDDGKTARVVKNTARRTIPPAIIDKLKAALDGGKAVDLGLFGRMLADLPEKDREAAAQVAHALSTHRVVPEFDFFTAVDDLQPADLGGSFHLGNFEFNSGCFYRYSNVNVDKLRENLQGDDELTLKTIETYMMAMVNVVPGGRQNSYSTHEVPSFVLAVVRNAGMISLANAFIRPVEPGGIDLISASVAALEDHWQKLSDVFGDAPAAYAVNISGHELTHLKKSELPSLKALVLSVMENIGKRGKR